MTKSQCKVELCSALCCLTPHRSISQPVRKKQEMIHQKSKNKTFVATDDSWHWRCTSSCQAARQSSSSMPRTRCVGTPAMLCTGVRSDQIIIRYSFQPIQDLTTGVSGQLGYTNLEVIQKEAEDALLLVRMSMQKKENTFLE